MVKQLSLNMGFWGASDILKVIDNGNGIISFHNPAKSTTKILLKKITYTNFSETPIKYDCITCNNLNDNLNYCDNTLPTTLKKNKFQKPIGKILTGTNIIIDNAHYIYSGIVKPFSKDFIDLNCACTSRILYPNTNLTYIFTNVYCEQQTLLNILFEWYECPLRSL